MLEESNEYFFFVFLLQKRHKFWTIEQFLPFIAREFICQFAGKLKKKLVRTRDESHNRGISRNRAKLLTIYKCLNDLAEKTVEILKKY